MLEIKTGIHCGARENEDLVMQTTTPTVNDATLHNPKNVSSGENVSSNKNVSSDKNVSRGEKVSSEASRSQYVTGVSTGSEDLHMVDDTT